MCQPDQAHSLLSYSVHCQKAYLKAADMIKVHIAKSEKLHFLLPSDWKNAKGKWATSLNLGPKKLSTFYMISVWVAKIFFFKLQRLYITI